ncbi:MAG: GNAT family N-acetyltransferase [Syntrophobacteraceae bacterium]|jgi:GNAT superfamily N-acetyltransferase|nr:GNAT family N-acetyltransferase [Syntrophobacteraceae bacterium]
MTSGVSDPFVDGGPAHEAEYRCRRSEGTRAGSRKIPVTTYYLEMASREQLNRRVCLRDDLRLTRVDPPVPELNRFFYTAIGADWHWMDRLPWTRGDWLDYLMQPGIETWVLRVGGSPAGYFELDARSGREVEIVYFGLLKPYTGGGLGAHLLTAAVERAWDMGARKIWLHTCSLDDPRALLHYLSRGFVLYRQEESMRMISS